MDYQEVVSSVGQETGKFFWTGEQVSINLIPGIALVAISIAGRRSHSRDWCTIVQSFSGNDFPSPKSVKLALLMAVQNR